MVSTSMSDVKSSSGSRVFSGSKVVGSSKLSVEESAHRSSRSASIDDILKSLVISPSFLQDTSMMVN